MATKLKPVLIEKPWGRSRLPTGFADTGGRKIGEISFGCAGETDLPLLAKYIFTSERLSVQVHPDDRQASVRNLPHGKTEAWYIVDAEPGATLGLGLSQPTSPDDLQQAALDGSIEQLVEWVPASRGDFFYVPAGTIHAIGAGVSLIEFHQNVDVTYRLYDYGRPRELHVDDAVDVAKPAPYPSALAGRAVGAGNERLVNGPIFSLIRLEDPSSRLIAVDQERWVLPLQGHVRSRDTRAGFGECLFAGPGEELSWAEGTALLMGISGQLD